MFLSLAFALTHVSISFSPSVDGRAEAGASSVTTAGLRAGFWWEDYDGDGLPDAFTITANGAARLLRNQGDGTFADVTLIMLSSMLLNEMKKQDESFKAELAAQAEAHAHEMQGSRDRLEAIESLVTSVAAKTGLPTDGR